MGVSGPSLSDSMIPCLLQYKSIIIILNWWNIPDAGVLADRTNLCDTVEKDSLKLKDKGKCH